MKARKEKKTEPAEYGGGKKACLYEDTPKDEKKQLTRREKQKVEVPFAFHPQTIGEGGVETYIHGHAPPTIISTIGNIV